MRWIRDSQYAVDAADGKTFYGGTYFPKARRYGMPAFMDLLRGIANAWKSQRSDIEQNGTQLQQALAARGISREELGEEIPLDQRTLELAVNNLGRAFDAENGGWGGAPKFPQPMTLEFLIRLYTDMINSEADSTAMRPTIFG